MSLKVRGKYGISRIRPHHDKIAQYYDRGERRRASGKRLVSSFSMLIVLVVGAGLVYTWYMGQQQTALANQPAPERKTRAVIKPRKVSSTAPIGVATQTATGQVKPGENASISVRSSPEVDCGIVVKYKDVVATDSGLKPQKADEFGVASWAWTVPPGTPEGVWPIEITCKNKKHSAVVNADLQIKR